MNKSTKENISLEPQPNNEQADDNSHVSPSNANAVLAAGWIPVGEKLPDLDTRCLIVEADGNIQICNYCKSFWNYPRNSIGFLDEQDEQPSMCSPTHWMPLPDVASACR